jgi:putative ABC transport system ATP-binding protein
VVFQFFQLLPTLTAAENVMLPMDLRKTVPPSERRTRALELLTRVGMEGFADRLPHELSGGQQQRVAIARALANDPSLILADEPTGNLDSATSSAMLDLFVELQAEGVTVVVVSHEREISRWASRTVEIRDGKLIADQSEILPDLVASEVLS